MPRTLSLTERLIGTLALGTFALLLVGIIGMFKLQQSQERFDYNNTITYPAIHQMADLANHVALLRINALYLATVGERHRSELLQKIAAEDTLIDKTLANYQSNYDEQDVRMLGQAKVDFYKVQDPALVQKDKDALAEWRAQRSMFFKAVNANDRTAIEASYTPFANASDALTKALQSHMQMNFDLAQDVSDANQANYLLARNLMLGLILAAVLLTLILGVRMLSSMRQGLISLRDTMIRAKEHLNLTVRVPVARRDEIGETSENFNELLAHLQDNLRTILHGADGVAHLVSSVTNASNQVSNSANVQSDASSAMAASIEQMTVSINHVAERACDTRDGARGAGDKVKIGTTSISETINDIHNIAVVVENAAISIRQLDQESEQVANVVQIIREIADQTNLLALNAAIEAARAGEQGRGFAVVADEVRKLAERTAQSTLTIEATISKMRGHAHSATSQMQNVETLVTTGKERADQADQAIREIGQATQDAAERVDEISQAISEQGSASQSVAMHVEQVAGMAITASSAAAETAQLSLQLNALAQEQITILQKYKL